MANEYGIGVWGQNAWGENSDVNITVSGQQLSSSQGSVSLTTEINSGWGRVAWGAQDWGTTGISQTVALTGSQVNLSLGNESTDISFIADITGQQLNWSVGAVDPNPDESLIGQQINLGLGTLTAKADVNVFINNSVGFNYNTFGDAQLSTAQKKFGTASLALDGSGDYITSTQNCSYLASDFTLEFFIYSSAITTSQAFLIDTRDAFANNGIYVRLLNSGNIYIGYNTINVLNVAHGMSNNTWHHVALTRSGSTWRVFIDGALKQSATGSSSSFASRPFKFGGSGIYYLNGYVDEFRASNIARYTSSFGAPNSPFDPDGNTSSLLHFDGTNGSTTITDSIGQNLLNLEITEGTAVADAFTAASVTGLQFNTFNPGTVAIGGIANIPVTGIELTVSEGTVDPGPDVVLPSVQANVGLGTAILDANTIASVTGQQLNWSTGNVSFIIDGSVQLTGNRINIALGNENIQSWQIVDTGTTVAYTEVSIGSSVTWNEIDTAA